MDISTSVQMLAIMAFAMTGIIAVSSRGVDLFSACVFGTITAIAGGTIRDLILGVPVFRSIDLNYIWASLDPVVEHPAVLAAVGEFHKCPGMCTHRASISAVCGYSSLSTTFLSMQSSISWCTSGFAQDWQKVAGFWRELPSIINSSRTTA